MASSKPPSLTPASPCTLSPTLQPLFRPFRNCKRYKPQRPEHLQATDPTLKADGLIPLNPVKPKWYETALEQPLCHERGTCTLLLTFGTICLLFKGIWTTFR